MITRVYGRCDNQDITFSHSGGNLWTVQVPAGTGGAFYVEVYAEDTAGNTAYVATILITRDASSLRTRIEITETGDAVLMREIFGEAYHGTAVESAVEGYR